MGITRHFYSRDRLRVLPTLLYAITDRALRLRARLVICVGLEILVVALGMTGPFALKLLIDGLTGGHIGVIAASGLVIAFIVGTLGGSLISAARRVYSQRMIDTLNSAIVDDVLKEVMPDLASRQSVDSGHTLGLIERLPYNLQILIEGFVWQIVPLAIQVGISLTIIAGVLKPLYVLVLGVTITAYAAATWFGAVQQQAVSQDASAASGEVSRTVADILRNARRVVLNGALAAERRLVRDQFEDRAAAFTGMLSSQVQMGLLQYGIAGLGLALLLILGCRDVLDHTITAGDFVLLQAYAFRLVLPLSGFGFLISQSALAMTTVRETLLLGAPEAEDEVAGEPLIFDDGAAVTLQGVSFHYGRGLPGLTNVSLTVAPGAFAVIVGPNGSGKSTLAQLMAGILTPDRGEVRIGGLPLQNIPPSQRHRYLLYVPQTVSLLNRSLLANALYPPTSQTEAELERLLTEWRFYDPARAIDFTAPVGEQGEHLSGGQRQKLELARLARVQVPVLILDESTSALDPVSEAEIIRTLRSGYRDTTTLVLITHRVDLAEAADQVIFMKNGTVQRTGTHESLLKDSAAYQKLWQT